MTSKMKKYIMQLARTKAQKTALAIMTSVLMFNPAYAAPTGGEVVGGVATINQAGAVTTINQASQQANINWQSFGIAKNETVNFNQPNAQAIALNRVVGNEASNIYGKLNANGQVFLINPNGILFSKDAKVNVGGLVASTLDIDKIDGTKYNLKGTGTITNQGTITAKGRIAFIANVVDNQGKIINHKGITHLSAGEQVTINKGESFNVTIHKGAIDAQINNGGAIISDSGQIYLTANAKDALSKAVINHTGIIEANTALQGENGKILLIADMQQGTANINGTINAKNEYQGNGGFIETSGARVKIGDNAKISTQATNGQAGTWLIDPTDFTIAASGGDMTGAAVANSLNNGNLTIQSASGASGTDGDIHVNDNIAWSQNKLTLTAHRNININSQLNGSGTANLALEYGQGSTDGAGSDYFVNAPINLPKGDNFSTKKGSNGTVNTYTVITELGVEGSSNQQDLQGMSGGLTKNYVLGANIDAAATGGWDSGAGFTPIGTEINKFTGKFDGLGHTISNLNINRPTTDYVGLFGYTDAATISNIGMVGGSITGKENVGGLLGMAGLNSTITNAYATGVVNGTEDVGGLAGIFGGSTITNAYATGVVSGAERVGGLAGLVGGSTITNSHATGVVSGTNYVGGLAGEAIRDNEITNAYATGAVSGTSGVGGLAGVVDNKSSITNAYATGKVTGTGINVGGLAGQVGGSTITNAYATGAVTGDGRVGGLAGFVKESSTITNAYATGAVTGTGIGSGFSDNVGGLAGLVTGGTITNAYATGAVTGIGHVGGLAGEVYSGGSTITSSYWDTQTTGQTTSAGGTGVTGKTTDEMKQVATFAGWEIDKVGGGTEAWRIYEGNTSPLLKVFLKPLKVTAGISNNNVIYNGSTQSAVVGGLTYITSDPTAVDATKIHGSANGSGSGTNAGDYEIAVSGEVYSEQSGYDIQMQNAIFTIKKAPVNVNGTIAASNKTYDGTTAATLNTNAASLEGVIAADAGKVTLDFGTGEFSDKNVGTGKTVTLTGLSLSGDAANNYELGSSTLTTTADISKAPISDVSGITANDKVYDGNTTATLNTSSASFNGMFQYDNLTVATSTGVFAEKDAGNGKTVNISNITLGGTDAGNYELGNSTATATANITPAPLTISANDISRMLGNAYVFSGTEFTASGLVNGETIDTVKIDSTGKNATVPGNFDINITGVNTGSSDFDIGNYNPTYVDGKLNIFIEGTIDAGSITKNIKANDPFQNNGLYPLVGDWSSVSIKAPAVKAPTGYLTSIDGKLYWVLNK